MCKCWLNYVFLFVIAVFSVGSMLSACGVKGPLYLPQEEAAKQAAAEEKAAMEKKAEETVTTPAK
jgi:predicted small lipoprotein YifL